MKFVRSLILSFMAATLAVTIAVLLLPGGPAVANGVEGSNLAERLELSISTQATTITIGNEAHLSVNVGGGTAMLAPQVAAAPSGDFVAAVYQSSTTGGNVYLQWTKGLSGWVGLPTVLGQGKSPRLVFSGTDVVHVVWTKSNNTQIVHKQCSLTFNQASCSSENVIATAGGADTFGIVDLASDGSNLHAAWVNSTQNRIETSRRSINGTTWDAKVNVPGNTGTVDKPVLAANSSRVILAYENNSGATLPVFTSTIGVHSWTNVRTYDPTTPGTGDNEIGDAAITVNGSNAFLVWTIHSTDVFRFAGAFSNDGGNSWPVPASAAFITSTNAYNAPTGDDEWLSKDSTQQPREEESLQPSVVLSGTDRVVAVWDARQAIMCPNPEDLQADSNFGATGNGTAEIFYGVSAGAVASWPTAGVLAGDNLTTYSIDPDVAVDASGNSHVVYMKATGIVPEGTQCVAGGGTAGYGIYYQGPYAVVQPAGGVYLPIILK